MAAQPEAASAALAIRTWQPHSGPDSRPPAPAGRRSRQATRRTRRVEFTVSDDEYAHLRLGAQRAGLATGAYAAQAAIAVARRSAAPAHSPLREALGELIQASGLVRRIGVNLNQAVAKLNATGQRSGDLVPYAEESLRRAAHLDAVAEEIRRRLP